MSEKIKITLVYRPLLDRDSTAKLCTPVEDDEILRKELEIARGTDISDVLEECHGAGLARMQPDHCGGRVVSDYFYEGPLLEDGAIYHVRSRNVSRTIEFMRRKR